MEKKIKRKVKNILRNSVGEFAEMIMDSRDGNGNTLLESVEKFAESDDDDCLKRQIGKEIMIRMYLR